MASCLPRSSAGMGLLVFCTFASACRLGVNQADPITISWNTPHQVVDGFGASATGYTDGFSPEMADQFFSAETGLGLSILRIRPIPGMLNEDCWCVANAKPYRCEQGARGQVVSGDLQVAQIAASRGVRVIATPWSPPGDMKTSGMYCSNGSLKSDADSYLKYAGQLVSVLALLRDKGVAIEALSVQNEPDIENPSYDTCRWTGQQIHDFIPYLAEALRDSGFGGVKIASPEQSTWSFDLLAPALEDPKVADKVGLVFGHAYDSDQPSGLPAVGERHVWQTEAGDGRAFDGGMSDGLRWAHSIHNYMVVGANAWMYWSLACGERFFNHANNMCLTDQQNRLGKRGYVLGQFSKFVRPGWRRVGVTNAGSLLVTAYRGPQEQFAIVVVNGGTTSSNQPFVLNGIDSRRRQVTPWMTSRSTSLQAQPAVMLGGDGSTFTYTIPGQSVVTFQGRDD